MKLSKRKERENKAKKENILQRRGKNFKEY